MIKARAKLANKSSHRMSGNSINLKFGHRSMPLIGALCRSVRLSAFLVFSLAWLAATSCSRDHSKALVGTWRSDVIKSELGPNQITVCYFADGHFWQSNDFIGGGVLGRQGTYQVRRSTLVRTLQGST